MILFAIIALAAWIPVSLILFTALPPRAAALCCVFLGLLLLPIYVINLPGVPDPDRNMVVGFGILAGTAAFAPKQLAEARISLYDLPILLLCLCPAISSLANDLGPWDALSAVFEATAQWLPCYIVGRIYFSTPDALLALAKSLLLACVCCLPFLLLEVRLSPKLHLWIYGFAPPAANDGFVRGFGIWKPALMFHHALNAAAFMAGGFLAGVWFTMLRTPSSIRSIPVTYWTAASSASLLVMQVLGGWASALLGLTALLTLRFGKLKIGLVLLAVMPALWVATRASGTYSGRPLVEAVQSIAGDRRGQSFEFRVDNEDMLVDKALERPISGWGRWGRSRVYDEYGKDLSVTDGLWIIQLGQTGMVGLAALLLAGILPGILLLRCWSCNELMHPAMAGATVMSVIVSLSMLNNIFNSYVNPISLIASAGIIGMCTHYKARVRRSDRLC